jgi:hypothetical protein
MKIFIVLLLLWVICITTLVVESRYVEISNSSLALMLGIIIGSAIGIISGLLLAEGGNYDKE